MTKEILKNFNIEAFEADLLTWYDENKRALPWRMTNDPYKVWVSEIMLQQTRVDTVIPYFNRFIEKYPSVYELAEAEEEDVLKSWEGLGYYSRARNLQEAIREVVDVYEGKVPDDKADLGKLKGVGPYTRGAILSIAFNQPEPAVDGNVMRVFSRLMLITDDISLSRTRKVFEEVVGEVISKKDPSSFNQGIMDLGATICTPKKPACLICPVQQHCKAFHEGVQEELPVKKRAKKQKVQSYAALIIKNREDEYLIEKRPETGLLANLYQFPMILLNEAGTDQLGLAVYEEYGIKLENIERKGKLKHIFSHIIWDLEIFTAETADDSVLRDRLEFLNEAEIDTLPFPVPHQKMMEHLE